MYTYSLRQHVCLIMCFHYLPYASRWGVQTVGEQFISTKLIVSMIIMGYYWGYFMMTSNGNIFRVTGHLCGEFTGQRCHWWLCHFWKSLPNHLFMTKNIIYGNSCIILYILVPCHVVKSPNTFEYQASINEIYRHPVTRWVAIPWFKGSTPRW